MRPLPDIPLIGPDAPLTPRGRLAFETSLLVRAGATELEIAEVLGISVARVRRRRSYAQTRIIDRLNRGQRRCCLLCGELLAVDCRSDALYCQTRSSCRSKMSRRRVTYRRSYRGHWSTNRRGGASDRLKVRAWLAAHTL